MIVERVERRRVTAVADSTPSEEAASPRRWLVLAVLAAVAFMAQLDLFIVNVALPSMANSFDHAALRDLSWVLNGYAIVFAALLVPMGRLADQYGRKLFLLSGVAVFAVGSAISAAAPALTVMVVGRIVQAVGAAMIVPTSLGLLYPSFPRHEHARVVGIWAAVAAVAAASGPTVGGILILADWRLIFLINIPIAVATIIAGVKLLPEVRAEKGTRLPDALSGIALVATLAFLTFGVLQSSEWGWGDARTIAVLAAAAAAGAVTLWRTLTHSNAVIEASLFRSRPFSTATVAMLLFFLGFAAWLLNNILFFQDEWHWSALRTGLAIAPGPLAAAVLAVNAGRIIGRFGRTVPAVVGPMLFAIGGVIWFLATTAQPDYWQFLPGLVIAGAGAGLTQAPLFAAANTLPTNRATTGSAVLNMSRQVGSAVGVAILVTILESSGDVDGYRRGFAYITAMALAAGAASAVGALSGRRRALRTPL